MQDSQDAQKKMVCIPAGTFLYGEEKQERQLPQFWMGKTPVTNAEYARFVAATGGEPPKHWQGQVPPEPISDHPVTFVSWHDAMAYAEWAGARLPSEEEWEKAARGDDGREYPWGKWGEERCNTKEAGVGTTTPVGQYAPALHPERSTEPLGLSSGRRLTPRACEGRHPELVEGGDSPYGCADMAGNVFEWTASQSGKYKVLRGGSFNHDREMAYCTFRVRHKPSYRFKNLGFRVASKT